jgi:hypothetical protein
MVLEAPVGLGDHPGVESRAGHHREVLAVHRPGVQPAAVAVQPDPHRLGEVVRDLQVRSQEVRGAGGQDRHGRVHSGHGVDAALDGAIATPDEQDVHALLSCATSVFGCVAALLHLMPQRVGHSLPGQDLPELGQAAAEALATVRHHGDVRRAGLLFPGRSAHTFRQRASHSP